MKLTAFVADARKFLTALTGLIGVLVTTGVLHGDVEHWVTVAVAAVTAALVYLVPNGTTVPAVPVPPTVDAVPQSFPTV